MKLSEQDADRHFTTSAYIVDGDKILLVNHKKYGLWLPVGGHIEKNETPVQALRREVREEAGLEIEVVQLTDYDGAYSTAEIVPAPCRISLHNVGDHHHMDLNYVARIVDSKDLNGSEECKWFTLGEIKNLDNCPEEVKCFIEEAIRIAKV